MATQSGSPIVSRVFEIRNSFGLHAYPASQLMGVAKRNQCALFVKTDAVRELFNRRRGLLLTRLPEDSQEPAWTPAGISYLMWIGGPKGSSIELGVRGAGENPQVCLGRFSELFSEAFEKYDAAFRRPCGF